MRTTEVVGAGEPDLRELRRQQARALAQAAGMADFKFTDDTLPEGLESDGRFDNKYGHLAERLHAGFYHQAKISGNERAMALAKRPNALHGLYVMTRLLSYAAPAYKEYMTSEQPDKAPDIAELAAIMKRSKNILKLFADRDIGSNHIYEINFGLLQFPPVYEKLPFEIKSDENGEPSFQPSPKTLQMASLEAARHNLEAELDSGDSSAKASCPAIGITLNSLWDRAIEQCVEDPQLFAAEVEAPPSN